MPMTEIRPCLACGMARSERVGEVDGFPMQRCRNCRTLFTAQLPGAAESTDYGAYYHAGNLEVPPFVGRRLAELVSSFDDRRRLNAWLDVGCGAGTLMQAACDNGWGVVGSEVAEGSARALRAKGLDVRLGQLRDLGLADGTFDVVSMVEVVEHVPDPRALFGEARRLLRPGGALYITTPHARGLSARVLGLDWSVIAPPEHLQLFSSRGLRLALEAAGLNVRSLHTHAVNPGELLAHFRSRRRSDAPVGRVESGYRLNESLSSSRTGALAKHTVNAMLDVTRLGDSIKLVAEPR
jgi:SAM-dependent methyltransferase